MIPRPARAVFFLLLVVLLHGALRTVASAVDLRHRSVSSSGQFVIYCDDRDARAGEKFAESDLLGIPYRVVIGKKSLETGTAEVRKRTSEEIESVPFGALPGYFA